MIAILTSFLLGFFLLLITIYLCKKLKLKNCLDLASKPQKVHTEPIPRVGGIPLYATLLGLLNYQNFNLELKLIFTSLPIFLGGAIEDLTGKLDYKYRFIFMILASIFFIFLFKNYIVTNLGVVHLNVYLGILFTIFALVGITNAFNIIDGINGLASGIALIIFITLLIISLENTLTQYIPILEILTGALLAFFILNFFFNLIFLGDSGSYLVGFLSGILAIFVVKDTHASPWVPIVLMFYPIWETLFSIFRRFKEGKSPFHPDRYHFHHLLYEYFGKSHTKATGLLLLIQALIALLVLFFYKNSIILISALMVLITLYILFYRKLLKLLV